MEVGVVGSFMGDEVWSSVRSMNVFSEGAGRLRLMNPSRGPRPLTKAGPWRIGSGEGSVSFSTSDAPGSAQGGAKVLLGSGLCLGSGFRRLNGRRAEDGRHIFLNH